MRVEQELDEELRYHVARQTEENIAAGMSRKEARYAALRLLEGFEQNKEECRDMRGLNLVETAMQDLRYGIRSLRKNPGFAVAAVLVMALGIGANTAVFSVVNSVLLKPLAYRDSDRIVTLASAWKSGATERLVALPDFRDWHDQSTAFSAMGCYRSSEEPARANSETEYVRVARVSPEFFRVLAVEPAIGREFDAQEERSNDSAVALISYSYWQSHLGGNSSVLGTSVHIAGQPLLIVGVLPPRFHFPENSDIWRPLDSVDRTLPRTSFSFLAMARLKPNVSIEQARAQLASIAGRLENQYPDTNKNRGVAIAGMRDDMVSNVRLTLYLLLGAVCLVLLIACANVTTLLLAKATARTREIAIRAAVGAGRGRILRQLITESLLLAFIAGAVGLMVAWVIAKGLIELAPADVPRLAEAGIDGRVLLFTACISLVCSLIFGMIPAIHASRLDLSDALKQGGARAAGAGRSSRLREALVVVEIALSVMLLAGAGLLLKSFVALNNVALGFRPERVMLMKASYPASDRQGEERARRFFKQLLSDIAGVPGVSAAGATMGPPGHVESAGSYWTDHLPQRTRTNPEGTVDAVFSVATPGTFRALGIPLIRGRDFSDSDAAGAPLTAVINETLARKAFPGQDPIGRLLFAGFDSDKAMKIVGIVGDVRQWGPARRPDSEIYMPFEQHMAGAGTTLIVVVRTSGVPEALTDTLRRTVHDLAPDVPVKFTTMEASLSEEVAAPRFRTLLLGIFAGLSICLAVAGVYGVTAYIAGQRLNEIGLRVAMGATPSQVLRLILRRAVLLATVGMALGFAGSVAGARLITALLFEVASDDPVIYSAVAVLLGTVMLLASYLPARRASRLDPLVALRQE
jgi:putative ABC transport system permease protein